MNIILKITSIIFLVFLIHNCTDKFDGGELLSSGESGGNLIGDTIYIQQFPVWEGFNKPQDILIGHDGFIYVADTENNRIVLMNAAGQILGVKEIQQPVALAQDYQLNLLVCARFDSVINATQVSFSALFKLNLVEVNHQLGNVKLKRLLPSSPFDFLRTDREYTGVAAFFDNSFIVSRTGPLNSNPIDPDNAILIFRKKFSSNGISRDSLFGRIPLLEPLGTGLLSTNKVSSLRTFDRSNFDIVMTLIGQNSFKTQWLEYTTSSDFEGYRNKVEPFSSSLMVPGRFIRPEGVAFDNAFNIYVADAEKDSILKFNTFGDELESFGGSEIFNQPHAVAFSQKILYVADTFNDRILRFILSTEID